jgi:hypothetical protein
MVLKMIVAVTDVYDFDRCIAGTVLLMEAMLPAKNSEIC